MAFEGFSFLTCNGRAPVQLPDGATVHGVLANLYDVSGDFNLQINLRRKRMHNTASAEVMASASTVNSSGWALRSDLSIVSAVIDNANYWYYFDYCLLGGETAPADLLRVQAVQLIYTP